MIDSFQVLYEHVILENLWKFSNIFKKLVKILISARDESCYQTTDTPQ